MPAEQSPIILSEISVGKGDIGIPHVILHTKHYSTDSIPNPHAIHNSAHKNPLLLHLRPPFFTSITFAAPSTPTLPFQLCCASHPLLHTTDFDVAHPTPHSALPNLLHVADFARTPPNLLRTADFVRLTCALPHPTHAHLLLRPTPHSPCAFLLRTFARSLPDFARAPPDFARASPDFTLLRAASSPTLRASPMPRASPPPRAPLCLTLPLCLASPPPRITSALPPSTLPRSALPHQQSRARCRT
jgi:hypothetical protein